MDHLENLDVHEFLAALGKNAIAKATQGSSISRPKQFKRSDIVFVEDTDDYPQLSHCGLTGRGDKGLSSGGGWKASGFGAKKKDNSSSWKNTAHSKGNCGWTEKKQDTQSGGWQTSTLIEAKSGWGEEGGWDTGTQQNCDDGWGEKQDSFQGWRQETDRDNTGWGDKEETHNWKQGTGKAGSQVGRGSSIQEEGKGCGSRSFKEDVPAPGGWERSMQEGGVQKGWTASISQEINDGWGEDKTTSGKWEPGSQEGATQNGWGSIKPQDNNCGWGESASEVLNLGGGENGLTKEGFQEAWRSSINQPNDAGWGEGRTASGGWATGAQEKDTQEGWGSGIDRGKAGGCGEDKGIAGGLGKKKEASAPGGWEGEGKEEGTQNGWKRTGGSGEAPSGWNGGNQLEEGVKDGWERSIHGGNDGGWGEEKRANCGWGQEKEVSASNNEKSPAGGSGKQKEVSASCGWGGEAKQDGTQDGWESSVSHETTGGWGEDKSAPSAWGRGNEHEGGAKDGWGSCISKGNDGGWGKDKGSTDEWGKKKEVPASGETKRESQDKGTQNGWESSTCKNNNDGWGEGRSVPGGWESRLHQKNSEMGRNAGGWAKTKKFSDSGGWEWGAHEGGTSNGWRSSMHGENELKAVPGGWGKHSQTKDTFVRSESSALRKSNSGWGQEKRVTADGWGMERKVMSTRWGKGTQKPAAGGWGQKDSFDPGRWRNDARKGRANGGWTSNSCDSGWGKRMDGTAGRWGQGAQQNVDDGWGKSIEMKESCRENGKDLRCSGWGEEKEGGDGWNNKTGENIDDGWGAIQEVSLPGAKKTGALEEVDNGWEKKIDCRWGEKIAVTARGLGDERSEWWEGMQEKDANSGWGNERQLTSSEWRPVDGVDSANEQKGKTSCNPGRDMRQEKISKLDKAEGAEAGWEQSMCEEVDSRWEKSTQKSIHSGWESRTEEYSNAGWGETTVESNSGGLAKNKHQVGDDGWGECAMEKNGNPGWGSTHSTKANKDKVRLYSEETKPDTSPLVDGVSDWQTVITNGSENPGAEKRRRGTFGPSGSNTVPLGKRKCILEGNETSDWKSPNCNQLNDQRAYQDGGHTFGKRCNDGCASSLRKDRTEEKAMEGAAAGWEQSACQEVDDGWGEKTDNEWSKVVQKDTDLGWGQEVAAWSWKEKSDCSSRLGKAMMEQGSNMEGANKVSASRWGKGGQKSISNGWESRMQEDSNAGWGQVTAACTAGHLEENTHQVGDDGWGQSAMNKNNKSGWGSMHDAKVNNDRVLPYSKLTKPDTVDGLGCEQTVNTSDNSGSIDASKKGSGWEPCTQELTSQHRHSGTSTADWFENPDNNKRGSGAFGPSGSNTLHLGKRKGISEGCETSDWEKHPNSDATLNQLSNQRAHQDGSYRFGRRFNNCNASSPWRDSALNGPNNNNRRPRLRALISLPEYSEMDELYKTTNKILHHSGYQPGDRLKLDDERFVVEKVLAHHGEREAKLGCGLDYLMIDSHADHQVNCFWVVRMDGSKTDFSYWKCLEHLFEVKYPHAAKDARKELGKDGCVVALNESIEAKVKESKEEGKDFAGTYNEREAEENVNRQGEEDGW